MIYGMSTPPIQGKMIRQSQPHVKNERVPLPLPITDHHKNTQLYIYIFYANGVNFLNTRLGKINFHSVQACVSGAKVKIIKGLEIAKKIYETRVLNIKHIMDTTSLKYRFWGWHWYQVYSKFVPETSTLMWLSDTYER